MNEFLILVAAIFVADCLFEICRMSCVKLLSVPRKRSRDLRGRFVRADRKGLRRVA